MAGASTPLSMSPGLLKVAERAKQYPNSQLRSLVHHIDALALERAHGRLRKEAAVGVDGVTVEQYGQGLADHVRALCQRMKANQYRHQPIRRVHIPKQGSKTRPIGISTTEDKIVQSAVREVLEAVYEQDFLDCSHGFRPGRSAHDALRALDREVRAGARHVLEADIVSFFDSIDRKLLMEMLRDRIADEPLLRLIGKCLHVGVLEGSDYSEPEMGTAQGSVLSPLLGNIYLHCVLDTWFERVVKPRLVGRATLVRYADDFVILFSAQVDAERVWSVLGKRMQRFGLTLHPEKTRLLTFRPPEGGIGKGSATFDFLGFTVHWCRTQRGNWRVGYKTRRASLRRAIQAIADWCRRHRHQPVKDQHVALSHRLRGHFNYFGVNGNTRSMERFLLQVERVWRKWLARRSQRGRMSWQRFKAILEAFALPVPRVTVQIWA